MVLRPSPPRVTVTRILVAVDATSAYRAVYMCMHKYALQTHRDTHVNDTNSR